MSSTETATYLLSGGVNFGGGGGGSGGEEGGEGGESVVVRREGREGRELWWEGVVRRE